MELVLVSASQVSTYRDCARKWALRYIADIKAPPHPSAALGTEVDDEQVQPYLREGRSFDFSKPLRPGYLHSADIALSMKPFLPQPRTVEIQHYFQIPGPGSTNERPYAFQGYMDLYGQSDQFPGVSPGLVCVGDTKTTSDLKWAKTEKTLRVDVQSMLYATAAMYEKDTREVALDWIYGQTKRTTKAKHVTVTVSGDHVAEQFMAIDATARELVALRATLAGTEGALSLPPSPEACEAYGGCPYRDRCNLSPAQIVQAHAAKYAQPRSEVMSSMDLLSKLREKKAARSGGVPPSAPASAAADAPPVAPPPSPPAAAINPPESTLPPPAAPAAADAAPAKRRGRPAKAADPAAVTPIPDVSPNQTAALLEYLDAVIAANTKLAAALRGVES